MKFHLPSPMPEDTRDVAERIFGLFPDLVPDINEGSNGVWTVMLHPHTDALHFVDPGVAMAAQEVLGVSVGDIEAHRSIALFGRTIRTLSLVHSWALLGASHVLSRNEGEAFRWIVHVDDHTDLMPALVVPEGPHTLRDGVFSQIVDLHDPASVEAAILRGAVNKGNFLTTYLLGSPSSRVIHVREGAAERYVHLRSEATSADLNGFCVRQTMLRMEEAQRSSGWDWMQTPTLPEVLPPGTVWLDIDLDAFCNRFNGDSDARGALQTQEEADEFEARFDHFLRLISESSWLSDVELITVAISPGFFPADYWSTTLRRLDAAFTSQFGPLIPFS